jgi:hypothetical protein
MRTLFVSPIESLRAAARAADNHGHADLAVELRDEADCREQDADRRPGDFADDAMGDPSFARVPGMACS